MSGEAAEIKIRLVLDKSGGAEDATKKFVDQLKQAEANTKGVNAAAGAVKTTTPGAFSKAAEAIGLNVKATDNWKAALGLAKGAAIGAATGAAAALTAGAAATTYAANASINKLEKQKALAAELVSLASNKNTSFGTGNDAARAFDRDFRKIAISAGAMRDEVSAAFVSVSSGSQQGGMQWMSRLTTEESEKIVKNMAMVAREVPGGLATMTASYDELKNGTISSESAIVQMITASGRLKGTAVDVSRQLLMMAPADRLKVAEEAIASMAKTSQFKPRGWEGLKASAKELGDLAATSMGDPIVNALLPRAEKAMAFLSAHADEIDMAFQGIGEAIGSAADYMADKFSWIYENKDALAKTFKDVFGVVSDSAKYLVEKAELIANKLGIVEGGENDKTTAGDVRSFGKEYAAEAGAFGATDKKVDMLAKRLGMMGGEAVKAGEMTNDEVDKLVQNLLSAHDATKGLEQNLSQAVGEGSASKFTQVYNQAVKSHNQAQIDYAVQVLAGSSRLQKELYEAGSQVEGGLSGLASALKKFDMGAANAMYDAAKKQLGTKAMQAQVNFNGNTFNIRQDFRDQDPDRIALVFQSDILRNAQARLQAKGAQPFGL